MYKDIVKRAIDLAENLNQIEYIEEKIKTTDKINRRTKDGREITKELMAMSWGKAKLLVDKGEQPFT